jgi:hypothetical protein
MYICVVGGSIGRAEEKSSKQALISDGHPALVCS